MAWQDRLEALTYEAPSGAVMSLLYEDVATTIEKKGTVFEFPEYPGSYVQDLGPTGRRFPMRVIISGDDYDQQAATFFDMLSETGTGRLQHPLYGTFNVVPMGTISRRDNLKTRANQAVFEVEFFETTGLLFPTDTASPGSDAIDAIDEFNTVGPSEFEAVLDVDTTIEEASLKDQYQAAIQTAKSALDSVAAHNADIKRNFDAVFDAVTLGIDTLIGDPLTLAFETQILMQLPARAGAAIADRLNAYANLLTSLTSDTYEPGTDSQPENAFRNVYLFASNAVIGATVAVIDNDFETAPDALNAAAQIVELCEELNAWKDANLVSLSAIDDGTTYQQVLRACSLTAGYLVGISFSLKQERSIDLDRPRTPLDLESEFYGTVDTNLDFLIQSNALVGEELFIVPAGRTVKWYV